jgi:hypothetical protein
MLRCALLALSALTVFGQTLQQDWRGQQLDVVLRATAITNLTWQLDTLAGRTNTEPKDYEDLWRNDLAWTSADARQLNAWRKLWERHRRERSSDPQAMQAAYALNFARASASVPLDYQYRIAAANAADLDALTAAYTKLCGKACASRFIRILRHFEPRFTKWWTTEGLPTSRATIDHLHRLLDTANVGPLWESALRFTAGKAATPQLITLNVIVHPKQYLTNMTATVMEDHMLLEAVDDPEFADRQLPIVVHEMTHHFYEIAPLPDHLRLVERFAQRPEPYSLSAYSVLNEALAISVQFLLEKRILTAAQYAEATAKDEDIYGDPFIAQAGRAAMPIVEEMMARGQTLFNDDFVERYVSALGNALGPKTASPRFVVSSRVLIADRRNDKARDQFTRSVRGIWSDDTWTSLKKFPDMSAVVLLTKRSLPSLRKNHSTLPAPIVDAVIQGAAMSDAFTYAWRRSPKAIVYFLYGASQDQLLKSIGRFAANDAPINGLLP